MLNNGPETIKNLFDYINIVVNEPIEFIINDVSFEKMRNREDIQAKKENWAYFRRQRPTNIKAIKENKRFFNVGKAFYFSEKLTEDQVYKGMKAFEPFILKYWPNEITTKEYLK